MNDEGTFWCFSGISRLHGVAQQLGLVVRVEISSDVRLVFELLDILLVCVPSVSPRVPGSRTVRLTMFQQHEVSKPEVLKRNAVRLVIKIADAV